MAGQRVGCTPAVRRLADAQDGVVARGQLLALGLTESLARQDVRSGRWRRLLPGVYATFTGPVPERALAWAAVLYAGEGAMLAGDAALWLAGLSERLRRPVPVLVPHRRTVASRPEVAIRRRRDLAGDLQPGSRPPRQRLEPALLAALDDCGDAGAVVGRLLTACQRRLTTPDRLRAELAGRSRHRWRTLVQELAAETDDGVASPLERRYLHGVERAHQLPVGRRNQRSRLPGPGGGSRYDDITHEEYATLVELGGRAAHPDELRHRDQRRDNASVAAGLAVLRYGWAAVVGDPCAVAAEVAAVLRSRAWNGLPRPCGPACGLNRPGPPTG